jgi:bacillithiol system protein YtxJ
MMTLNSPDSVNTWGARPGVTWILKHSRICPVSAAAKAEVEAYAKAHPEDPVALVVVQDAREASDHLARVLGVPHASPQLLLIEQGRLLWHASHGEITQDAMEMQRLPGL